MLPGVDGIKVCEMIKKYNKNCIIAAITSNPSGKVKKKMLKSGADYYFNKPVSSKDIINVVKKQQEKFLSY